MFQVLGRKYTDFDGVTLVITSQKLKIVFCWKVRRRTNDGQTIVVDKKIREFTLH